MALTAFGCIHNDCTKTFVTHALLFTNLFTCHPSNIVPQIHPLSLRTFPLNILKLQKQNTTFGNIALTGSPTSKSFIVVHAKFPDLFLLALF